MTYINDCKLPDAWIYSDGPEWRTPIAEMETVQIRRTLRKVRKQTSPWDHAPYGEAFDAELKRHGETLRNLITVDRKHWRAEPALSNIVDEIEDKLIEADAPVFVRLGRALYWWVNEHVPHKFVNVDNPNGLADVASVYLRFEIEKGEAIWPPTTLYRRPLKKPGWRFRPFEVKRDPTVIERMHDAGRNFLDTCEAFTRDAIRGVHFYGNETALVPLTLQTREALEIAGQDRRPPPPPGLGTGR